MIIFNYHIRASVYLNFLKEKYKMKFLDYSHKVFLTLQSKNFKNYDIQTHRDFLSVIFSLKKDISLDTYRKFYKEEIEHIIDTELPLITDDSKFLKTLKNNYFYDETTPKYSTLYLFWIWNNNIDLDSNHLQSIVKAIFMGTVGHRFVDMYADGEKNDKEFVFLSNYLIRSFENTFINILGIKNTYPIMYKYAQKFASVEYLEKRALWKQCPFSYDCIEELSYKSAPLLAIFESIFTFANYDQQKKNDLIKAFMNVLAVNQMADDLTDAKDDLSTGRETLVMAGFYRQLGTDSKITNTHVDKFLTQDRMLKVYKNMRLLLEDAITTFNHYDDEIFLLFTEFFMLNFHKQFNITEGS